MLKISSHRRHLIRILKQVYSAPRLRARLGFKGGTAAYLFYGLSRFSVDLDFDLLDKTKQEMVFGELKALLGGLKDMRVKEAFKKRNTLFFLLSYAKHDHNIKVEISKRNSGSSFEVRNYLGISMLVIRKEDMVANKLMAMTERRHQANRDFFDAWFFLKEDWQINEQLIKDRLGLGFDEYLTKVIKFVEKIGSRGLLHGMGEVLDEKQKIWVKNNLKDDLLFQLKLRRSSRLP